jgi:selenocysteine lyase/cysteine desulfurase
MAYTRREFLSMVSAVTALAGAAGGAGSARARSEDDPLGVRPDFPVIEEGIYLNNPYIAPSPRPVVEATKAFVEAKERRPIQLGDMLQETETVRRKFARLVGASETEIGLLSTTTEGENLVVRSLDLASGDNVVIDDLHYISSYVLYNHLVEAQGIDLRIVQSQDGAAPVEAFAKRVDGRTKLISVAWVSHQNGYHHDLAGLADLAHAHGGYLYADAIQGVGMLSLDTRQVPVDFFTTGTYKWLLGGFGVAPFFVREALVDRLTPDRFGWRQVARTVQGHEYELHKGIRRFEFATPAFTGIYQLSAALDYILKIGVEQIEQHTVALAHRLHRGLSERGFRLRTPAGNRSAIVAFEHGRAVDRVQAALKAANIQVSFREENAQIRVGPALFNNAQEVDRFVEVMGGVT